MQQRQLRLGDVLDDYCPRERRITNHAVVAMVGDQVKQTRCTTCEADHEYKQAKVPASRKKKDAAVVASRPDVAGGAPEVVQITPPPAAAPLADADVPRARRHEIKPVAAVAPSEPQVVAPPAVADAPDPVLEQAPPLATAPADDAGAQNGEDEGPVHRRLIRATLPRQEGQITPRPTPQFTMRQPAGRPVGFGGKPRGPGRPHVPGGRPQGAGGKGGRPANFSRGTGGDAFGRGRVREAQPQSRHSRHASSGQPPRSGKKHSK